MQQEEYYIAHHPKICTARFTISPGLSNLANVFIEQFGCSTCPRVRRETRAKKNSLCIHYISHGLIDLTVFQKENFLKIQDVDNNLSQN